MHLLKATEADFDRIKAAYLHIIEDSPDMDKYARYEYGTHPSDEELTEYIHNGNMYMLMDDDHIAGVVAITLSQGPEYHSIAWQIDVRDDEVMVLHLLGIMPEYLRRGTGTTLMSQALDMARRKSLKACHLDTLESNIPAQRFYEKLGFTFCGKAYWWYAENTGWTNFYLYEYIL